MRSHLVAQYLSELSSRFVALACLSFVSCTINGKRIRRWTRLHEISIKRHHRWNTLELKQNACCVCVRSTRNISLLKSWRSWPTGYRSLPALNNILCDDYSTTLHKNQLNWVNYIQPKNITHIKRIFSVLFEIVWHRMNAAL